MKYYFRCPRCQSDSSFSRPSEESPRGAWLLPLVDPLAAAVYGDSQRPRIQCDHCGHLFRQPPLPKGGMVKLANAILALQVLTAMAAGAMLLWPELIDALPSIPWLEEATAVIFEMVSDRIAPFLLLAATSVSITVLICLAASISGRLAGKRALSKEFQIHVKERGLSVQPPPTESQ